MSDWSSGYVQTKDGVRIHYYRTGGDHPPMVLGHGFSDDGLCWTPVARALEAEYDVVIPSFRGHGLSDRLGGEGPVDLSHDLQGVIEGLGLQRPVVGGHSMGAAAAAQFAAENRELVSALVLEDPPWFQEPLQRHDEGEPWPYGLWLREIQAHPPLDRIAAARAQNPKWAEDEFGPWIDSKLRFDLHWLDIPPEWRPWREAAARLSCPGLLITGDPAMGGLVTPDVAEEVRLLWPSVQVAHIAQAGHNIRRDDFPATMRALSLFLAGYADR